MTGIRQGASVKQMKSMMSRVCNRELFKFYHVLRKLAQKEPLIEEDFLTMKTRAGQFYREKKAKLKLLLDSGWTEDKSEYLRFVVTPQQVAKLEEILITS